MADYKSMYYHLLRAQLKAVGILENAHLDTEKMFMDSQEAPKVLAFEKQREDDAKK